MPDLPFDVIAIILQFLAQGNESLACYAAINRVWNEAVELKTFEKIRISSGLNPIWKLFETPVDVMIFKRTLEKIRTSTDPEGFTIPRLAQALKHDGGRRRSYIREIEFRPECKNYSTRPH
ncbi:uncharacterized protein K452DRAFT_98480 [Aplosporella prunicola CBS 121167]|uniref:F-box domain-containing protein n=1 Tax=Aplosporella prunicola CBS 121167 TaxID=1176127 RepID=A0A6A6B339_9PEZI|nr:uncharacterized protein K452DRAFT_98480 [Aplosporella prunicola CBS 121167]KAF2137793.1 hypothetical protein K452DRAFT_98480 [Aplosporella prunicola CBS 121167]